MDQRSSFEWLTLLHLDAAFNLAFWLVRSEADAEDIVQDAYVRAFRRVRRNRRRRPRLLAIVRNAAYPAGSAIGGARQMSSSIRNRCRVTEPAEAQIVSEDPTPEERAARCGGPWSRSKRDRGRIFREVIVLREIERVSPIAKSRE